MWQIGNTATLLHCIDFRTYPEWQRQTEAWLFFQRLSDLYTARGWRLIHLWEDVWQQKPAIVLSRLRALAGVSERIPARLTEVRRIDRPTTARFLEEHHLQVVTQSKYKYGLFLPARYFRVLSPGFLGEHASDPELLVAVATFSHPRTMVRNGTPCRSVELVRFANHWNCTVVGGLDKLLKAFTTDVRPDDIMTYADRDWSDGRSYQKLGFEQREATEPQTFWVRPGEWQRFYPHHLPDGLTEAELPAHGFVPVYNSGSLKFLKVLKEDA
ncbi:hypothetical protein ACO2Q8_10290 [Larkinella sp. VNQ87]|uniref:hypothetical protein n=1 Tax=Larkinella sp. VNQ87 TaxID=3400921 RepID=UPI003C0487EF